MSDVNAAPDGSADTVIPAPPPAPAPEPQALSVTEAARWLGESRKKQAQAAAAPVAPPAAPVEAAAPVQEAAPPQEASGETSEAPEAEELPPIRPPNSWAKDEKERFQQLPRETQEYIAQREQERERELSRRQNEAAEKTKAVEAERQKAEQVRQQYEQALPALLQTLQTAQSGEFADIKTQEDVNKLAAEDWPRFAKYQAHLMQVGALEREVQAAQQRQIEEHKAKWNEFANREDNLLLEKVPELSDAKVLEQTSKSALKTLKDIGFEEADLAKAWNGEIAISPRDHRFQQLVYEATKYREAKANIKPTPKPVPPVQRPGTATSKGDKDVSQIQSLTDKFSQTRGVEQMRIGAELLRARRAAQR